MAQHLWVGASVFRICEVCLAKQFRPDQEWEPTVSTICPGDPDDGGHRRRPRPHAPTSSPRVLEDA
jgi:hypothetical protein